MAHGLPRRSDLRHLVARAIGSGGATGDLGVDPSPDAEEVIRDEPGLTGAERAALQLVGGSRAIKCARKVGQQRVEHQERVGRLRERLTQQARRIGSSLRGEPAPVEKLPTTIMVVDDEPAILTMIVRILKREGHGVTACASFEEAKSLLRKGAKPDIVITDIVLDGSTGKRVADAVQKEHPRARVIFISGYGNIVVGGRPVLQKPFTRDELLTVVDQSLAETSAEREAHNRRTH